VFKVIRRCDKELGRELMKWTQRMPWGGSGSREEGRVEANDRQTALFLQQNRCVSARYQLSGVASF
jgi:hypothetical protein